MGNTTKTVELVKEKETKNTFRFAEVDNGKAPVLSTLYVHKWAIHDLGDPTKITVTIAAQ